MEHFVQMARLVWRKAAVWRSGLTVWEQMKIVGVKGKMGQRYVQALKDMEKQGEAPTETTTTRPSLVVEKNVASWSKDVEVAGSWTVRGRTDVGGKACLGDWLLGENLDPEEVDQVELIRNQAL